MVSFVKQYKEMKKFNVVLILQFERWVRYKYTPQWVKATSCLSNQKLLYLNEKKQWFSRSCYQQLCNYAVVMPDLYQTHHDRLSTIVLAPCQKSPEPR